MGELLSSDFTLIGATLAGLALTSLGILHDFGPFHLEQKQVAEVAALAGSASTNPVASD